MTGAQAALLAAAAGVLVVGVVALSGSEAGLVVEVDADSPTLAPGAAAEVYAWVPLGVRGAVTCVNPLAIESATWTDYTDANQATLVTISARNTSDQEGAWGCSVFYAAPEAAPEATP